MSRVCSARAEMFLASLFICISSLSLLRTSGDVSLTPRRMTLRFSFAPHERRCFRRIGENLVSTFVCSARAEMFPGLPSRTQGRRRLLRTSGDVSERHESADEIIGFAPHERRCFSPTGQAGIQHSVCSARAEMFPIPTRCSRMIYRLLRTSGDVSNAWPTFLIPDEFAPHERRCFFSLNPVTISEMVCSARAEMFLAI